MPGTSLGNCVVGPCMIARQKGGCGMPRRVRADVEGCTACTKESGRVNARFRTRSKLPLLSILLREVKKRDGLAVFAYCLLPNHFHLAARTRSVALRRTMRALQHQSCTWHRLAVPISSGLRDSSEAESQDRSQRRESFLSLSAAFGAERSAASAAEPLYRHKVMRLLREVQADYPVRDCKKTPRRRHI
jgi:hypothetical protein